METSFGGRRILLLRLC
uniref:Uncharacterized protein n=1 Tax=Lepeophtheirus salmonis TaxID=72036 RepID=A0A0K2UW28_LEPSM